MARNRGDFCSRPLPEPLLKARIESGEIGPDQEICPSTGYWFPVADSSELRRFLGDVRLPGEQRPEGSVDVTSELERVKEAGAQPVEKTSPPQKWFWAALFLIFCAVYAILWMSSR
jgi:hypothetical protein